MEQEVERLIKGIGEGRSLTRTEAERVMEMLLRGEMGEEEIGSLLVGLREKGETVDELVGFALAMRMNARDVFAGFAERPLALVDTCGTGGDGAGTFNVSTVAALVAAGAGAKVAKHGNRSISSNCGSADVLEALGVNVEKATERAAECISEAGIAFVYAPAAHGATRRASVARKTVGGSTVFNLLGPLTNPARPTAHVAGVFDARYLEAMAQALGELGTERAMVVHSAGGMDEIALDGETYVAEWNNGAVRRYTISARDFGLEEAGVEKLLGGDAAGNAEIIREVMRGERGARRDFVVAGAAAALYAVGMAEELSGAARMAEEAIDSGAAAKALESLVELTRE
jgi:anthranilate phosphoribosyltransferase